MITQTRKYALVGLAALSLAMPSYGQTNAEDYATNANYSLTNVVYELSLEEGQRTVSTNPAFSNSILTAKVNSEQNVQTRNTTQTNPKKHHGSIAPLIFFAYLFFFMNRNHNRRN